MLLSIVVPVYNEADSLPILVEEILKNTKGLDTQIILVDDGSKDSSAMIMAELANEHKQILPLYLSRNYGKEIALTAGLREALGDAVLMMDSDLQHPPRYIPEFIKKWQEGFDVVIGVRTKNGKDSLKQELFAKIFYKIINRLSHTRIVPNATDYRLIDRQVVDQFNHFTERNRIVRGLIDWLGYDREYIYFEADKRQHGEVSYSTKKLIKLAVDTFISMSMMPLRFSLYLGSLLVILAGPLGLFIITDTYFLGNHFDFSGPAALGVLTLFMIGITLVNLGLVSLYIAQIHNEVTNRPLYALKKKRYAKNSTKK